MAFYIEFHPYSFLLWTRQIRLLHAIFLIHIHSIDFVQVVFLFNIFVCTLCICAIVCSLKWIKIHNETPFVLCSCQWKQSLVKRLPFHVWFQLKVIIIYNQQSNGIVFIFIFAQHHIWFIIAITFCLFSWINYCVHCALPLKKPFLFSYHFAYKALM